MSFSNSDSNNLPNDKELKFPLLVAHSISFVIAYSISALIVSLLLLITNAEKILSSKLLGRSYYSHVPHALSSPSRQKIRLLNVRYQELRKAEKKDQKKSAEYRKEAGEIFEEYTEIIKSERIDLKTVIPEYADSIDYYIKLNMEFADKLKKNETSITGSNLLNLAPIN